MKIIGYCRHCNFKLILSLKEYEKLKKPKSRCPVCKHVIS